MEVLLFNLKLFAINKIVKSVRQAFNHSTMHPFPVICSLLSWCIYHNSYQRFAQSYQTTEQNNLMMDTLQKPN